MPHNDGDALAFDASGNLWIGTNGGGLSIYKAGITPPPPLHVATIKWTYEASATIEWFDRWEDGLATGDLNDDGAQDVVLGTAAGDAMALNGLSGEVLWTYAVPNTNTSVNVDIIDVDGNGSLDIVAGGKASSGNTTIVALNKDGSLKWQVNGDYQETTDLAYGDINHDGASDVAAAIGTYPNGGGQVILLDGRNGSRIWDANLGSGIAFGIDAKDMDGDGDMEIAVTNYNNKVFLIDGATNSILWSQGGVYYGRDVIIENIGDSDAYKVFAVMGNAYCYDSAGTAVWSNSSGMGENLMLFDANSGSLLIANPWTGQTSLLNGFSGEPIWTRHEAGLVDFGDLDGNGTDDIVGISTKYYDPPFPTQYMRAMDSANTLLWEFQLDAEPSAIEVANIDWDSNDEVLVAIGQTLQAFDVVPSTYVDYGQVSSIPEQFSLYQNYPNPFNPTTTITFDIAYHAHVELQIINLSGQQVRMLFDGAISPGKYTLFWDGCDDLGHILPSGIYFYSLIGAKFLQTRKMLLVR
ncbi:PQQ-binding-like beta-propeller repeat protein [candidate division KSB1 bacterium]|nr:PQQ-binding-like beta-propeller repeat protein [candidate division KSB1 bacterium]